MLATDVIVQKVNTNYQIPVYHVIQAVVYALGQVLILVFLVNLDTIMMVPVVNNVLVIVKHALALQLQNVLDALRVKFFKVIIHVVIQHAQALLPYKLRVPLNHV